MESQWYEDVAQFTINQAVPMDLRKLSGPRGPALVSVYTENRTQSGWGLAGRDGKPGFMENYLRRKFDSEVKKQAFIDAKKPFAFVMRSMSLICVDIDRHNGSEDGFRIGRTLDLPPTLAETSKSGEGRHLFYSWPSAQWNIRTGFDQPDKIGIRKGLDIRGVGCVFHYATQRWNDLAIAPAPDWIVQELGDIITKIDTKTAAFAHAKAHPEDEMTMVLHDTLLESLNKRIDVGKRNATLFAIAVSMYEAGYPDWEREIARRGTEVGLSVLEIDKICANAVHYSNAH